MKRTLIAGVLATAVLLPTGVAEAKWSKGQYSGATRDGVGQVTFEASGKAIKHFAFDGVKTECSDGIDRVANTRDSSPLRIQGKSGKFAGSGGIPEFTVTVKGKLKNGRASGMLRVVFRTTADGALSETGEITCDSGPTKWRATA